MNLEEGRRRLPPGWKMAAASDAVAGCYVATAPDATILIRSTVNQAVRAAWEAVGQRPLFDAEEGEARREEAIARVDRNANPNWKELAADAVVHLAAKRPDLTTDDVWFHLGSDYTSIATHERRAMGAIMRKAAKNGTIAPTPDFRPSERPVCHRGPKRVWRSLIFRIQRNGKGTT